MSKGVARKIQSNIAFDQTKTKDDLTADLNAAVEKQHKPERASWLKAVGYHIPGNNKNYFMGDVGGKLKGKEYHFSIFRDSVVKPVQGVDESTATIVDNLLAIQGTSGHHITLETGGTKPHVYREDERRPLNATGETKTTLDDMKKKLDAEVARVTTRVNALRATKGRDIQETKEP